MDKFKITLAVVLIIMGGCIGFSIAPVPKPWVIGLLYFGFGLSFINLD